jgi:16S rRNA (cytosine1402-N4)-methyltransferase
LHKSVLLKEAIAALNIKMQGVYVDATFGRGGHSTEILKHLNAQGRLLLFDQDPQAIAYAQAHFGNDARIKIIPKNFEALKAIIQQDYANVGIDGVLFDLGVSSPQLDEAPRGFSFLKNGPLDMRMNPEVGVSCAEVLQTISETELTTLIKTYGEEKFAHKIAHAIVSARTAQPLKTTQELANLIEHTIPKRFHERHKHPATRTFQALRIYINRELEVLTRVLADVPEILKIGARAVFISFHSLEDRLVKQKFQALTKPQECPRHLPIQSSAEELPRFKLYIKMQKAEATEVDNNPRASSAVLRVIERIR